MRYREIEYGGTMSPSLRRVWVEIRLTGNNGYGGGGHPPCGGCGLKLASHESNSSSCAVTLLAEGVG